jgi:hypothetical protein
MVNTGMPTQMFAQHGFSAEYTPHGSVNKVLCILRDLIDHNFADSHNLLVDATWLTHYKLQDKIDQMVDLDNLFLCTTVDDFPPDIVLNYLKEMSVKRNVKVYQLGTVKDPEFRDYSFDFWSISVKDRFKNYDVNDLSVDFSNLMLFLCYQNKPHYHRQYLTKRIIDADLMQYGILTLQKFQHLGLDYPDLILVDIEQSIDYNHILRPDAVHNTIVDPLVTHSDVYSLGDLRIWQRCFLNVVSETLCNSDRFMISEKTFKPLIGMRPFVLNGPKKILKHLRNNGFYTFEEYWHVDFNQATTAELACDNCVQVIKQLSRMSAGQIQQMYSDMYPKLVHNRNRFFEYANEQEHRVRNLFNHKERK